MILKVGRKARREKDRLPAPLPKTDRLPAPPPKASGSGKPTKNAVVQSGAHGRQDVDQDSTKSRGNVNDNADSICWFCHADVTNLANNKCAGCRKVKTPLSSLQILIHFDIIFSCFRRATATRGARERIGSDMEIIASRCRRRSGRRLRQRRQKMKGDEMSVTYEQSKLESEEEIFSKVEYSTILNS